MSCMSPYEGSLSLIHASNDIFTSSLIFVLVSVFFNASDPFVVVVVDVVVFFSPSETIIARLNLTLSTANHCNQNKVNSSN